MLAPTLLLHRRLLQEFNTVLGTCKLGRICFTQTRFSHFNLSSNEAIITALFKSQPSTTNIFTDSIKSDISIDLNQIQRIASYLPSKYDDSYLQDLGKNYVYMAQANANLLHNSCEDIHKSVNKRVEKIILPNNDNWQTVRHFYRHIGHLIYSNKFDDLDSLLPPISYHCHQFVQDFNSQTPQFNGEIIDESYLTNVPDSQLELPKLTANIEFNPLFLSDEKHFDEISKMAFKSGQSLDLVSRLNSLHDFGLFSYQFHKQVLNCNLSDEVLSVIVKDSLLFNMVKLPQLRKLLQSLSNDTRYISRIFYQYLGLLSLGDFPIAWLHSVSKINYPIEQANNLPINRLVMKTIDSFPRLEITKVDNLSSRKLEKLGKESLSYCITKLVLYNNDDLSNVKKYENQIIRIIESTNGNNVPLLLGLLARKDLSKFETFVQAFFQNAKSEYTPTTISYIKSLIVKYDIPLPYIRLNGNQSKFTPPALSNSILNRFFMINCILTKPELEGNSSWKSDFEINRLLKNHQLLGDLEFKFLLNYHLKLNELDGNSISKFLSSDIFKRYIIDESNFFKNQDDLIPDLLRNSFSVVSTFQFNQFFATLSDKKGKDWVKTIVDNSVFVSHNYFESEQEFCKLSNRELANFRPSLNEISKSRTIERMKGSSKSIMRALETRYPGTTRKEYVSNMGRQFVLYFIMKYNIEGNRDSFINANQEMVETFDILFPSRFYELIGYNLLNGVDCELILMKIAKIMTIEKFHKQYEMRDKLHLTLNFGSKPSAKKLPHSGDNMKMLPIARDNDLTKLLLIHQGHCMTFFRAINTNPKLNNKLANKIIQFGELGLQYYKFSILKLLATASSTVTIDSLNQLHQYLMDKKFRIMVNESSPFILQPFKEKKAIELRSALMKKYSSTEYLRMKFHAQLFNQYIGNLSYQDPPLVDEWLQNLVSPILQKLLESSGRDQQIIIGKLQDEINRL